MSQNWYANNIAAPYIPTTFRGSWDKTTGSVTGLLDFNKLGKSGNTSSQITNSETSATNPFSACIVRLVSRKLAAQTISGTLNMVMAAGESNADANMFTKIFAYVTQGDTDTPRGTLLDYTESSGTGDLEWPTTTAGQILSGDQTLSSVAALEGDRIVIEFGFSAENSTVSSRTGRTRIGARTSTQVALDDLINGSTSVSSQAGFFTFSNSITLSNTEPTNVTPETATDITSTPYSQTVDAININTPLWYKRTAVSGDNNGHCVFSGVSAGAGDWTPTVSIYYEIAANNYDYVGGGYFINVQQKVIQCPVDAGTLYYYQIEDMTGVGTPTTRSNVFALQSGPTMPSVTANKDNIFISADVTSTPVYLGGVVDKASATILGLTKTVPSENGAVNSDGVIALSDKGVARLALYNPDFTLIGYVTGIYASVGNHPVCCDGTNFYTSGVSGTDQVVKKISPAGVVLATYTITGSVTRDLTWIAVNSAGTILYYHEGNGTNLGLAIKKWDLNTDSALSDFLAGIANRYYRDGLVRLTTGEVVFALQDATNSLFQIDRYDAAGALQLSFNPASTITAPFLDHHAFTTDDSGLWIWFQGTDAGFQVSQFRKYTVSSGALALTLSNVPEFNQGISDESFATASTPTYFQGIEDSCPLLILNAPAAPTNTLTVIKVTDPTGSLQSFDFTASGGAISPTSFSLLDGESRIFSGLADDTYDITEVSIPSGWTEVYLVSNGDPHTAIVLAGGVSVTVTVTNTLAANFASGIYEMIKGKTNDTIWIDPGVSDHDVKIP